MIRLRGAIKSVLQYTLFSVFFLGTSTLLTGCGGSKTSQAGLPTPPVAGAVNS